MYRRIVNGGARVVACLALVASALVGMSLRTAGMATAVYPDAGVLRFGAAPVFGNPRTSTYKAAVVGMAATHDGRGYWLVTAIGGVKPVGDAHSYGQANGHPLYAPVAGIVATPDGHGYWLYAINGQIFAYGDARNYGGLYGKPLRGQIVSMAATADGKGYWLLSSRGMIWAFGDARYEGSLVGSNGGSVVAMIGSPTADNGYWVADGNGRVTAFGTVKKYGDMAGRLPAGWINSIAAAPNGKGYWLANANGNVYNFGSARFEGRDAPSRTQPIQQIVADPAATANNGYWLLEPDAFTTVFSANRIVRVAESQIAPDPDSGSFCNPYGPCEPWCALFATWVWRVAGVPIPHYAFVGYIYDWARSHTQVLKPSAHAEPGDIILYGTGPQNVDTAVHTGIVAQVWADGAVETIEGDSGPAREGRYNVTINGPFLPSQSSYWNGTPVFGFAVP